MKLYLKIHLLTFLISFKSLTSFATNPFIPFKSWEDSVAYQPPKAFKIPGLKQKKVGMGLTIAGLALMGTSITLLASSKWQRVNNGYVSSDPSAVFGGLLILPSLGFTIPGSIVWGVGSRKYKRFKKNYTPPPPVYYKNVDEESIPTQERY